MALRVWLHRTATNDIDAPWALALYERCQRYHVLPGPGGAYDQDEYLMAAMEQAAAVNMLFDADARTLMNSQQRLDLHTRLQTEAAEVIEYINAHEVKDE